VILLLMIALPILGGVGAWMFGRSHLVARWIALLALGADLVLSVVVWIQYGSGGLAPGNWMITVDYPWMPDLGISLSFALDGLSLLMVVLTAFLGVVSILISWDEIHERVGFFHFNLLWILGGVTGVFLAMDLFLFYFFWEVMIIPMYFVIAIWGYEKRVYAATKFFIFTQASGLLMLLSILGLFFLHGSSTGTYTFRYFDLLGTPLSQGTARWLMLGFFVAFAVKLPAFPFHPWLPDAHTQAPTAGSVILAGLMLKTGAYGLIRFVVPLFPTAAFEFAPFAMIMGVVGIVYGAVLAFAQTDMKRLVAYTSVSHLGFVMLGVFAWNEQAIQGSIVEMLCHGLSTGALFIIVGILQHHIHTRDMDRMGGLWETAPRMGVAAMIFAMASLGLPGLGNFIGEFLVLLGSFRVNVALTSIATAGLVAATVYSLWVIQRAFHGERREHWSFPDLTMLQTAVLAVLVAALLWIGLYPAPVLDTARGAVLEMQRSTGSVKTFERAPERQTTGREAIATGRGAE
jgi:NADH-quinone oxidoreductase subunit M